MVVDPLLSKVLRPHQREVFNMYCYVQPHSNSQMCVYVCCVCMYVCRCGYICILIRITHTLHTHTHTHPYTHTHTAHTRIHTHYTHTYAHIHAHTRTHTHTHTQALSHPQLGSRDYNFLCLVESLTLQKVLPHQHVRGSPSGQPPAAHSEW